MTNQKFLFSILGPTATGKTNLALFLAQQVVTKKLAAGISLISADSRQVYKGLEILTGADIPNSFVRKKNKYDFFQHSTLPIELHGISILKLNEDWSVAHFCEYASKQINLAWKKNYLPMVVGGTGFYHQQLTATQESLAIKPNPIIREKAKLLSVDELLLWLKKANSTRFKQLNQSDRNNKRRLTRAIEIEEYLQKKSKHQSLQKIVTIQPDKKYSIGLKPDLATLKETISKRTKQRFFSGAIDEVKHLLNSSIPETSAIKTTAGVEPISRYLDQSLTDNQVLTNWATQELQYAKRQLTWFNKHPPDLWLKSDQKLEDLAWQSMEAFLSHSI